MNALNNNSSLRELTVPHKDDKEAYILIEQQLETTNRTLGMFETKPNRARSNPLTTLGEDKVDYYLTLNQLGRKTMVDPETSKGLFVTLLCKAMNRCQEGAFDASYKAARIANGDATFYVGICHPTKAADC